ncbi:conserved hypothetical protein [Leishmania infantum JPCM5]|uniref:Uncharacterized protein n=2 Tax=Leishmania infantum TaxID=5671 RepID=A4I056_LEIIN|nr:conserved hypothetical protein [Leishmania infantum JPCM5]CAM68123.1 conserved hypothetical protein [Leishmania infantum JPCM5]|eukprot:XP_001465697.1 conserved hypothetical protein [Leishmania infantum JPCM5]
MCIDFASPLNLCSPRARHIDVQDVPMERNTLQVVASAVNAEALSRAEDHACHASPMRRVYRLRDSCAALQLILLAYKHRRCSAHSMTVAMFVEACASDLVQGVHVLESAPLSSSPSHDSSGDAIATLEAPWFDIGSEAGDDVRVYLLLPTYADYFFDYTMYWARVAYSEMARQCAGHGLIAKLQTVGGGWASLHRADKSLACALQLHAVAQAVFDEDVVRKCRLFIGWAHLWNSDPAKALEVFYAELAAARRHGDPVHERRCLHAIQNAEHNPRLAPGGAHTGHYQLVNLWWRALA